MSRNQREGRYVGVWNSRYYRSRIICKTVSTTTARLELELRKSGSGARGFNQRMEGEGVPPGVRLMLVSALNRPVFTLPMEK